MRCHLAVNWILRYSQWLDFSFTACTSFSSELTFEPEPMTYFTLTAWISFSSEITFEPEAMTWIISYCFHIFWPWTYFWARTNYLTSQVLLGYTLAVKFLLSQGQWLDFSFNVWTFFSCELTIEPEPMADRFWLLLPYFGAVKHQLLPSAIWSITIFISCLLLSGLVQMTCASSNLCYPQVYDMHPPTDSTTFQFS